ncbi:PepSY domain-containing protein, partial [Acinetobacter baumannii]
CFSMYIFMATFIGLIMNSKCQQTLMIGQKVYKSESNNLIMFIAVSLVLGLSLPVFGFSILFKLFIFAMRKYIPSKS